MAAQLADVDLFTSDDISQWQAALLCYEEVVALKAAGKAKKIAKSASKSGEETLVELDSWYQTTLPDLIASRDQAHLTHEELAKLMKWKLTRGKFRPRLTEMVKQNSHEEVETTTKRAFAVLPDLSAAMTHLVKLKAVGPATASAIMCAAAPEVAPFMADESVLAVPDLGKLDYTQKHYFTYAGKIQGKSRELSKLDEFRKWSAHDVELALWSFHFAKKLKPTLLEENNESTELASELCQASASRKGKKRDSEGGGGSHYANGEEEEDGGSTLPPSKKKRKC